MGTLGLGKKIIPYFANQIKKSQLIVVNNKEITVENFFKTYQGHTEKVALRGEERIVTYRSGIFKVRSQVNTLPVRLKSQGV